LRPRVHDRRTALPRIIGLLGILAVALLAASGGPAVAAPDGGGPGEDGDFPRFGGAAEPHYQRRERWASWWYDAALTAVSEDPAPSAPRLAPGFVGARVLPVLRAVVADGKLSPSLRAGALASLADLQDRAPETVALLERLQEPGATEWDENRLVCAALLAPLRSGDREPATHARLVRVATDAARHGSERAFAAVCAALLEPADRVTTARAFLAAATAHDADPEAAAGLLLALGLLHEPETLAGLERLLDATGVPAATRAWTVSALGRVVVSAGERDAERVAERLLRELGDAKGTEGWRWTVPDALARVFGRVPASCRTDVVEALRRTAQVADDVPLAGESMLALGRIAGSPACEADRAARLLAWLGAPPRGTKAQVAATARVALGFAARGPRRVDALKALRDGAAAKDLRPDWSHAVADLVAGRVDAAPLLARWASSSVQAGDTRATALLALAELDAADALRVARDVVRETEPDRLLTPIASRVLARAGDSAPTGVLLGLVESPEPDVAWGAARALRRLGDQAAAERLLTFAVDSRESRWMAQHAAIHALGGMTRTTRDPLAPLLEPFPWAAGVPALVLLHHAARGRS
jgi:hypothetical protein